MSDKERLEEIKNSYLEGQHILFGTSWVSMPKENFDWLIEQAEKAEKYREALEEIKSHQVVGVANWGIEYAKLQKTAHEALEGTE